jgi:hypothetical protein
MIVVDLAPRILQCILLAAGGGYLVNLKAFSLTLDQPVPHLCFASRIGACRCATNILWPGLCHGRQRGDGLMVVMNQRQGEDGRKQITLGCVIKRSSRSSRRSRRSSSSNMQCCCCAKKLHGVPVVQ